MSDEQKLRKRIERLRIRNRELNKRVRDLEKEVENKHTIIQRHLKGNREGVF